MFFVNVRVCVLLRLLRALVHGGCIAKAYACLLCSFFWRGAACFFGFGAGLRGHFLVACGSRSFWLLWRSILRSKLGPHRRRKLTNFCLRLCVVCEVGPGSLSGAFQRLLLSLFWGIWGVLKGLFGLLCRLGAPFAPILEDFGRLEGFGGIFFGFGNHYWVGRSVVSLLLGVV